MKVSRRSFIVRSVAGTAVMGLSTAMGAETCSDVSSAPMVAACGISCSACPLLKAKKCKGCGAGNTVSSEMVTKKNCPVLTCANMKKIAFCGTDCKMYTTCGKMVGHPYTKEFLAKIGSKLG